MATTRSMNRRAFGRAGIAGLAGLAMAKPKPALTQTTTGGRAYKYVHLDVFTDKRYQGNQLFVFTEPAGLDTAVMQLITKESNLSECTFVLPPEAPGTDFRVRIFSRTAEMPFAGHPTIGSAFALAHTGAIKPGTTKTTFGLGAGPTNLDLEWKDQRLAFAWMTQLKPTFGKAITETSGLAAALNVDVAAFGRKPAAIPAAQEVNCGSNFLIVPLATRAAVDSATIDGAKLDALLTAAGAQRRSVYVFSTERGSDDVTAYSRLLGTGAIEDPATGSAAGPAGCFAARYGLVAADRVGSMVFLQGVKVGRPSRLYVRVSATGSDVTGVKVGGSSVVVGEGAMMA